MIEIITTERKLRELADSWETLEKVAQVSPFSTYAWVATWWRHFGEGRPLRVLAAYDKDRLVGIAPFYIAGNPLVKRLEFIGSGRLADYGDLIIHPEADRVGIIGDFVDAAIEMAGWHIMALNEIPGWSPNLQVLVETTGKRAELLTSICESNTCPCIELEKDWDSYLAGLGRKITSDLGRRRRRLNELGRFKTVFIEECDDLSINDIIRLHGFHEQSIFQKTDHHNFFIDVTKVFADKKMLCLGVLKSVGGTIAFHYNISCGNKLYNWLTGFDPTYRKVSPGKILLAESVHRAFDLGSTRFDFMRGDEDYKFFWTNGAHVSINIQASLAAIGPRIRTYANQRIRSVVGNIR